MLDLSLPELMDTGEPQGTGVAGGDYPVSGPHPEQTSTLRGAVQYPPDLRAAVKPRGHPALAMTKETSLP